MKKLVADQWGNMTAVSATFTCGFCGTHTSPNRGYSNSVGKMMLVPCTKCGHATQWSYQGDEYQFPRPAPGRTFEHVPAPVSAIYEETRSALRAGTDIGAALLLRVMLFRVAKDQGIPDQPNGKSPTYQACIQYLVAQGLLGARSEAWVDRVRTLGNEANHEITDISRADVERAFDFMVHVLEAIYEHPAKVMAKAT